MALHALARLPGVEAVEPFRAVAVSYHFNGRSVQDALVGMPAQPQLERLVQTGSDAVTLDVYKRQMQPCANHATQPAPS